MLVDKVKGGKRENSETEEREERGRRSEVRED